MPLRRLTPLTFKPSGLADAADGTNGRPGSMSVLQDLVPAPNTAGVMAPRPASISITNFAGSGIAQPGTVTLLQAIGTRVYGMVGSLADGHDYPFCYDLYTSQFVPIAGATTANTPVSPLTTGDWSPPSMAAATNSRITITHPGFPGGGGPYFGWLDISSFTLDSLQGNTVAGSPIIQSINDGGSSAPIADGVQPGMTITVGGVTATVVSTTNGTFSLDTTGTTDGTNTVAAVASTLGVTVGMTVTGPTIATGSTVVSIAGAPGAYTVVLSLATLGPAADTAIDFSGGGTITMSLPAAATTDAAPIAIAGGTFDNPQWGSGNTNTNPLFNVPKWVAGFNGRAYYAMENFAVFSDVLNPQQVTNASQAIAIGDNTPVTALAGLPLVSQVTGGVVQSLFAFKGPQPFYQITGDADLGTLALNLVDGSIGTLAPNSIANTPMGLIFASIDGVRLLSLSGTVSEPIGAFGQGVSTPFINALYPSRMVGAYNQNSYRVSVQNGGVAGAPWQEYVLQFENKQWHGPHTFPAAQITGYTIAGQVGFVLSGVNIPGQLWFHSLVPGLSSTYVENGKAMTFTYETSLLPDNARMMMNRMGETAIMMMLPGGTSVAVSFLDEDGDTLNLVDVFGALAGNPPLWGSVEWGSFIWGGQAASYLKQFRIPWTAPLVFKQGFLQITGLSAPGLALGNVYMGYQILGYLLQDLPVPTGYLGLEATADGLGDFTALMATSDGAGNYTALEAAISI